MSREKRVVILADTQTHMMPALAQRYAHAICKSCDARILLIDGEPRVSKPLTTEMLPRWSPRVTRSQSPSGLTGVRKLDTLPHRRSE